MSTTRSSLAAAASPSPVRSTQSLQGRVSCHIHYYFWAAAKAGGATRSDSSGTSSSADSRTAWQGLVRAPSCLSCGAHSTCCGICQTPTLLIRFSENRRSVCPKSTSPCAKLLPALLLALRKTLVLAERWLLLCWGRAAGSGPCFPGLRIPVETARLLELLSDVEPGRHGTSPLLF